MASQSLQYEEERVLADDATAESLVEPERDEPVDRRTILVPVAVAFTAIALLTAVLVVPALTDRDGAPELETAPAAAVETPEPSVEPPTTTTVSPEAEWQAWADGLSPEEQLQLQFMLSTPEEKEAWLDYVAPEPEPVASSVGYGVWDRLANCESGGNWAHANGDSFDGGLQFHTSTWRAYGGTKYAARAYNATREQQIEVAEKVLASAGWGAWPACARKLGLR